MDAKKASLPVAALALALGGFAVGKQLGVPPREARIVSVTFEPVPTLVLATASAKGPQRRRLVCSEPSALDGKPAPQAALLCAGALDFAKLATAEAGKLAGD